MTNPFNRSQLEHAVFSTALTIPLAYGLFDGTLFPAAVASVFLFLGREYSQVEYKVREETKRSLTDMMPWHVLKPKWWSVDNHLDYLGCILGNAILIYTLGNTVPW